MTSGDIHKISSPPLKGGNDVIKIWSGKFLPSRLSQIWQAEPERNTPALPVYADGQTGSVRKG